MSENNDFFQKMNWNVVPLFGWVMDLIFLCRFGAVRFFLGGGFCWLVTEVGW